MNWSYEKETERLLGSAYEVGCRVRDAVRDAVRALMDRDGELVFRLCEQSVEIEALIERVDSACFDLITELRPVGADLRVWGTMGRIALDLERISRLATSIGRMTLEFEDDLLLPEQLQKMGHAVADMIDFALSAMIRSNLNEAEDAFAIACLADELESEVFNDILERMIDNVASAWQANEIMTAVLALRRAKGSATEMAKRICYMINGAEVDPSQFCKHQAAMVQETEPIPA